MQNHGRDDAFPDGFLAEEAILETILARNVDEVVVVLDETVFAHASACRANANEEPRDLEALAQNARRALNRVALGLLVSFFLRREEELAKYEPVGANAFALTLLFHAAATLISRRFDHERLFVFASDPLDAVPVRVDFRIFIEVVGRNRRLLYESRHKLVIPGGDKLVRGLLVLAVEKVLLHDRLGHLFVEFAAHLHHLGIRINGYFSFFGFLSDDEATAG